MKTTRAAGIFYALLYLFQPTPEARADWPGLGGPNGDFVVDAGLLHPGQTYDLQIIWKEALGTGYSGIAISGGLVATLFSDEISDYAIGLDADTGAERWRHRIGPTYLGHYGSQSGPLATPLIADGQVFALGPRGRLLALDARTGQTRWTVDLVQDHQAIAPFWGFTTSPRLYKDRLIVQTGGVRDNAISAFDPRTGALLWSALSDSVNYQSPGLFGDLLVFHGNSRIAGLDPQTGAVHWQFLHGGQTGASATSGHPVEIAPGRYLVKNRGDGALLLALNPDQTIKEIWRTRHIRGTYLYAVHHAGRIFGYSGRILTCIDAASGERVWRSGAPGDGLPIVVDGHLVILTKDGALSIAPATDTGYHESARLDLFADIAWSPPSFADGKLYARSMGEIAGIAIQSRSTAGSDTIQPGTIPGSRFAAFIKQLGQAEDQQALIDSFLAAQHSFPIVEADTLAHFIYRGPGAEVALAGDLFGHRYDRAMHRVAGTDLFYYSAFFEPDARISYHFVVDLQQAIPDPRNPRALRTLHFGQASELAMPAWRMPGHLVPRRDGRTGRIDTLYYGDKAIQVYLPAGYDRSDMRYPVVYYHGVRHHLSLGQLDTALDNLVGARIRPLIAVFLPPLTGAGPYDQYVSAQRDRYAHIFTADIVPLVDRTYRTLPDRLHRANVGMGYPGFMAFYATFAFPELFAHLAVQSLYFDQTAAVDAAALLHPAATQPAFNIYVDWGKYDLRSPMEGNNIRVSTAAFARLLADRGYAYAGGMVHDGSGWASWKNRTDRLLAALFPMDD